jgi:hypothetical protein
MNVLVSYEFLGHQEKRRKARVNNHLKSELYIRSKDEKYIEKKGLKYSLCKYSK